MPDDTPAWANSLGLSADRAQSFDRIAASLKSDPAAILRLMIDSVIAMDTQMAGLGLAGVSAFMRGPEAAEAIASVGTHGLPLDIRPTGFMWPADVPFPWSAEECRAAVLGYEVKWKGSFDDFLERLRGVWEMSDGYAVLRQS